MAKVGRGADQFPLRLPDGMRDWIKETAKVAGRSMNDEIVLRLERSLLLDDMGARPMQVRRHQNTASDEAIEHLRRALELLTSKEV